MLFTVYSCTMEGFSKLSLKPAFHMTGVALKCGPLRSPVLSGIWKVSACGPLQSVTSPCNQAGLVRMVELFQPSNDATPVESRENGEIMLCRSKFD